MLKTAYQLGVLQAFADAGIDVEKTAFFKELGQGAKALWKGTMGTGAKKAVKATAEHAGEKAVKAVPGIGLGEAWKGLTEAQRIALKGGGLGVGALGAGYAAG